MEPISSILSTEGSELLQKLRQKAIDSPFFVARALLGYDKLTPHLHHEMSTVAANAETCKRVLCLVPRNHYKTTICTITYAVWRAIRNPNETGLIITNSSTNAERFLGRVRSAFESSPMLRQLFPELRPEKSKRWNSEEACLPRTINHPEATWSAAGWDKKVTGGHFDWIVFDDLVDEETYQSPPLMHKLIDRFEQREALLRPPMQDRTIMVVMNHWSLIDLACHIINPKNHPEYKIYYRQAIENGKPIFPEMYSMELLLRKQKTDPYHFSTQWMNNPIDESVVENSPAHLQKYKHGDNAVVIYNGDVVVPLTAMNIACATDPRHSLSTTTAQKLTSRNAISVAGMDSSGRVYVLDESAARSAPEEYLKELVRIWRKWSPIGLSSIGIEAYGYQGMLKPLADLIWKDEPYKPRLELLPKDTVHSKETRIRGGYRFFAEDKGYTHDTMVAFNEEYLTFPFGKTRDMGDAFAWCTHLLRQPEDDQHTFEDRLSDDEYLSKLNPLVGM